jgi:alkanesulfonate monooxygenase
MFRASQMEEAARPGYWLNPFKTFQADCPYFVGSHEQVAQLISRLVRAGASKFILDIPGHEEEFENVAAAFGAADALLA